MGGTLEVAPLMARQDGVICRTQALQAGMDRGLIQRAIDDGTWIRLQKGVYAASSAPATWQRQVQAAYLSRPEVHLAGRTAAHLHGFTGVRRSKPEILVPFAGNARSPLARVIRSRHFELITTRAHGGMTITTIPETLLTLSFSSPAALVERWVDDLLASHKLEASEFDPIFARLTNARMRGLRSLRQIVLARDRDSYQPPATELERLLYKMLDSEKLPEYRRQVPFEFEQVDATVDAYVEEWQMIVEGDGRRWHTREADFERDRRRDNAAAAAGIQVIRFTYRMLKSNPDSCIATLLAAGSHR